MSDARIRVVVAPGRRVRIDPHPSGLEGMAPLYVDAGEGLTVSDAVADQLYRRGDVLHPQTGQARPAETFGARPLVTMGAESWASLAARADAETEAEYEERRREQRPGETVSEYRERKKRDEQTDPDEADASAFAARMRERARCAAILGSKAAGSRLDMAAPFAFATDMSRREADAALRQIAAGTPPPRQVSGQESFCARMDRQRSPQLGNGFAAEAPDASTPDGLARQMLAVAGLAVDRRGQQQ